MTDTPTPLQLASDAELIAELRARGKVTVIGMIKNDENAVDRMSLVSLSFGGDPGHALGLSTMLLRGMSKRCRELGMSEFDIHSVLAEAYRCEVPVRG